MKKFILLFTTVVLCITLYGCNSEKDKEEQNVLSVNKADTKITNEDDNQDNSVEESNAQTEETNDVANTSNEVENSDTLNDENTDTVEEPPVEKQPLTQEELETQLSEQELKVIETKYIEKATWKSDSLGFTLQNDTQYDIKSVSLAFLAWDSNNLPVKFWHKNHDSWDAAYLNYCFSDTANIVPGGICDRYGFPLDSECTNIAKFKVLVEWYETYTGEYWENPLTEEWIDMYEGKKLVE